MIPVIPDIGDGQRNPSSLVLIKEDAQRSGEKSNRMINVFINKAFFNRNHNEISLEFRPTKTEREGYRKREGEGWRAAGEQVSGHSLRCPIGQLMKPINNAVDR